jgi:hypothetical protein
MILLMLIALSLAVIAGIGFFVATDDDNPVVFFLSLLTLVAAICFGFWSYDVHENQMRNYETKVPAQVDTTIIINPDKTIDTVYTYHFPKE